MFNYEYPPLGGGGGVVHALIAEELARRHRVVVITSAFRDLPRHETRDCVEIHRVPVVARRDRDTATLPSLLSYPPPAWQKAYSLLRHEKFDVINSHFAVPTGPGSLPVARLARIPHVLSLHGGDIFDPSKRLSPHRLAGLRWTVGWVLRSSDAVVAQSSNTRENAYRYYRYDGPIQLIPLGIRIPKIRPVPRAELGLPENAFLGVTVGRLVKRKGIDRLLQALVRPECEGVHLAVVGAGPERDHLDALARRLGLSGRVHFAGRVDDERKWQILSCADAYVSGTLHEGFGLVYLEAMAAGLPVVSTDHGGQVDFLQDGVTGYMVRESRSEELGSAIARLATDPDGAAQMGAANRERMLNHRIEDCAGRYEELFDLLRQGRKPNTCSP
jgi:glycosyltransferase involved in cell wall biosynthesis